MTGDREHAHPKVLDRWLARGAIAVVMTLQLSLVNNFAYGSRWLAPMLELLLLVPLTVLSVRAERAAWNARTTQEWESATLYRSFNKTLGIALVTVISLSNVRSLALLVRALLAGATENGRTLLLDGLNVWTTNVIVFALWYWLLDRGGPSIDRDHRQGANEFIFPAMTLPPEAPGAGVKPGFIDYLFLSFNTSTAFSPTDTMPLSIRMKLLMMLEASVSLLTLALVTARAVNILA
jgi:uncharacterized membrane protein